MTRIKVNANQALVNPATESEESGQSTTRAIKTFVETISSDCISSFKIDQFWYALLFGVLPTAWDARTDISLGERLEREGRVYSAAFCWMFVCIVSVAPITQYIRKVTNSTLAALFTEFFLYASFLALVLWYPWATYYPAVAISLAVLSVKSLAVFLHTPGMNELTAKLSLYECVLEASNQLLLIECVNGGKSLYLDRVHLFGLQIKNPAYGRHKYPDQCG